MISRKMLTNCPNCAGVLASDGYCPYCNTKVRYANELDISVDNLLDLGPVEIGINIKRGNETIIYPFIGRINEMKMNYITSYLSLPEVELSFSGYLKGDIG